jgi:hypothetical protein
MNAISRYDITQEFHFKLMEFTHFQFGVKCNFSKFFQNKMYMVLMDLHVLQENEDVVNVTDYEIIQVLTKKLFIRC